MPFDPFNPENSFNESYAPMGTTIGQMGAVSNLHPGIAQHYAGGRLGIPGPEYYVGSRYGAFRGPTPTATRSPVQYIQPPSLTQSLGQLMGAVPAPMYQMPIEAETAALRNLSTRAFSAMAFVGEMGTGMVAGGAISSAMGGAGLTSLSGLAAGGAGLIGGGLIGAAAAVPASMFLRRQELTNQLRMQTRGLVTAGPDLDVTQRGLSMDSSSELLSQLTNISAENFRFNRTDLRNIIDVGRKAGTFQFTGQTGKEIGDAVKSISDMIVTFSQFVEAGDLNSAIETLGSFQRMGIGQRQAIRTGRTMRRFAQMAGMETGQMVEGAANVGAEAFVRYGLGAAPGMQAGAMMMGMANQMSRRGQIDPMTLSMLGGTSGLAQLGTNFTAQVFGDQFQKMLLPSLLSRQGGQLNLDSGRVQDFLSGNLSVDQMLQGNRQVTGNTQSMLEFMRNAPRLTTQLTQALSPEQMRTAMQRTVLDMQERLGPNARTEDALMAMGVQGTEVEGIMQMYFNPVGALAMQESNRQQRQLERHQKRRHTREENSIYARLRRGVGRAQAAIEEPFAEAASSWNRFWEENERQASDMFNIDQRQREGAGLDTNFNFLLASIEQGKQGEINDSLQSIDAIGRGRLSKGDISKVLLRDTISSNIGWKLKASGLPGISSIGESILDVFQSRRYTTTRGGIEAAAEAGDRTAKEMLADKDTMVSGVVSQLDNARDMQNLMSRKDFVGPYPKGREELDNRANKILGGLTGSKKERAIFLHKFFTKGSQHNLLRGLTKEEESYVLKAVGEKSPEFKEQVSKRVEERDLLVEAAKHEALNEQETKELTALKGEMGKGNWELIRDTLSQNDVINKADQKRLLTVATISGLSGRAKLRTIEQFGGKEAFDKARGEAVRKVGTKAFETLVTATGALREDASPSAFTGDTGYGLKDVDEGTDLVSKAVTQEMTKAQTRRFEDISGGIARGLLSAKGSAERSKVTDVLSMAKGRERLEKLQETAGKDSVIGRDVYAAKEFLQSFDKIRERGDVSIATAAITANQGIVGTQDAVRQQRLQQSFQASMVKLDNAAMTQLGQQTAALKALVEFAAGNSNLNPTKKEEIITNVGQTYDALQQTYQNTDMIPRQSGSGVENGFLGQGQRG